MGAALTVKLHVQTDEMLSNNGAPFRVSVPHQPNVFATGFRNRRRLEVANPAMPANGHDEPAGRHLSSLSTSP
jgi:hypothetical protein